MSYIEKDAEVSIKEVEQKSKEFGTEIKQKQVQDDDHKWKKITNIF